MITHRSTLCRIVCQWAITSGRRVPSRTIIRICSICLIQPSSTPAEATPYHIQWMAIQNLYYHLPWCPHTQVSLTKISSFFALFVEPSTNYQLFTYLLHSFYLRYGNFQRKYLYLFHFRTVTCPLSLISILVTKRPLWYILLQNKKKKTKNYFIYYPIWAKLSVSFSTESV